MTAPPRQTSLLDRAAAWLPVMLVGLTVLTLAIVYRNVFNGPPAGDDNTFHLGEIKRIADCIAGGDWDFWNWSANAGYASGYYYQFVPLFVPALAAAVTDTDVLFWFQVAMFLPLVLAPIASYRGARAMGFAPCAAAGAAICISFVISNSRWGHGADGNFLVGLYTQTWAFAAFPLALGAGVAWIQDGTSLARAVAWSAFAGVCHPIAGVALGLGLALGTLGYWLAKWVARGVAAFDRLVGFAQLRPSESTTVGRWRCEFIRLVSLGAALLVASAPAWLTTIIDYEGFGAFPHRVGDESGPGLVRLVKWLGQGTVLDYGRGVGAILIMSACALLFARGRQFRWVWMPLLGFALLLAIGPHLKKTDDDLLPAVRFLGPLQIMFGMAAGAGVATIATYLWRWEATTSDRYWLRGTIVPVTILLISFIVVPGAVTLRDRTKVADDFKNNRNDQLAAMSQAFASLGPGRKQGGPGAENHWWNLLPYVQHNRPALLQMGGGGLQASPNYDFLWHDHTHAKVAHVFWAPYVAFFKVNASKVPAGLKVFDSSEVEVRQFPDDGLVSPITITGQLAPGKHAALDWYKSSAPLANQHLVYVPRGATAPAGLPTSAHGSVGWAVAMESPGDAPDIAAQVTARAPTIFVARTSWHPRWRAFIDGNPTAILRVTPDFPAVVVPAGDHRLHFRFDRPWWANASWLLPVLVVLGCWLGQRRRASRCAT